MANRKLLGDSTLQVKDQRCHQEPSTDLTKLLLICCWIQHLQEEILKDSIGDA